MKKVIVDAHVDSMLGINLEKKSTNINHKNVSVRGLYEFDIEDIKNESLIKIAITKAIKKLKLTSSLFLTGEFFVKYNNRNIYHGYYTSCLKEKLDGEFIE